MMTDAHTWASICDGVEETPESGSGLLSGGHWDLKWPVFVH